ncbi:hypothetical protein EN873_42335 [bacterium M00.F.Ca.ET.230.01.1.1]|nr:hypothetical protein EN873_42335 [bacterium M00.F.Ca.ET.230.01.1.1]
MFRTSSEFVMVSVSQGKAAQRLVEPFLGIGIFNRTFGRWPISARSRSNETSLSRKPRRSPTRRLALSGPQRSQASLRVMVCPEHLLSGVQKAHMVVTQ